MASVAVRNDVPALFSRHIDIFICPKCGGQLDLNGDPCRCLTCDAEYSQDDQIPLLFWPHEGQDFQGSVTDNIRSFYEENPFPDYEEFDSRWNLRRKAQEGIFARLLDEQIPHGARVLEAGCGTGQLSNFL